MCDLRSESHSSWRYHSHLEYVTPRRRGAAYVRKNHSVEEVPEELAEKVYCLDVLDFEDYIVNCLYGEYDHTYEGANSLHLI